MANGLTLTSSPNDPLLAGLRDTGNPNGIEDPHSQTKQRKAKIFRAAKPKRARPPRIKGTRIPFTKRVIQYKPAQASFPKIPQYQPPP